MDLQIIRKTRHYACILFLLIPNNKTIATKNPEIIRPVATHAMAIVFGYVTPEEYKNTQEIEPQLLNPWTGRLDNSGVIMQLADLFNQNKAYILTNTSLFQAMIKRYPTVKLENWRCKAISEFVYLFVQNALLPPENLQNALEDTPLIEAIEPYLGIKISNKVTVSTTELRSPYYFKQPSKNLADECTNILAAIWDGKQSKIFIPKTDYATEAYQKMAPPPIIPMWAFLMIGFGKQSQSLANPDGLICGLQIPIFRQVLNFFASQITTGMLIGHSSYFNDINMVAALKDDNKPELKQFPYTIISTSIAPAPLLRGTALDESENYNTFFAALLPPPSNESWRTNWQPNAKNFETVINIACRPYRYFIGAQEQVTTPIAIPIARFVNNQFFVPAQFKGAIAIITDSVIKPGLEKQPLYTAELVQDLPKNTYPVPDSILLSLSKPFTRPLVLIQRADRKISTIIGINPGPTVYHFDEIDAHGARITEVIDAFLRIPGLDQEQAFVVKKLHAINDLDKLVPVNKPQPEKTYFELKIVHSRPEKIGGEGKNMVIVKQFDCTKNCGKKSVTTVPIAAVSTEQTQELQQPKYDVVAATVAEPAGEKKLLWGAIPPTNGPDNIDKLIDDIRAKKIPLTLGLFAF